MLPRIYEQSKLGKNMRYANVLRAAYKELAETERPLQWLRLKLVILFSKFFSKFGKKEKQDYLAMQRRQYQAAAGVATINEGKLSSDCVAAINWDEQNTWEGYIKNVVDIVQNSEEKIALEYGCGPGRNIINWGSHFKRIDGVDISNTNLKNSKELASYHLPKDKMPNLYLTTGDDCGDAEKSAYDFVFSVIVMQHIASYSVRFSIIKSMYECLKPGGQISLQFGYKAVDLKHTVPYYTDAFNAGVTNGACDVRVDDPKDLEKDFEKIGFTKIKCVAVKVPDSISSVFEDFIFVQAIK